MSSYYNEIDPFAAAWLRKLIERGLIAPGEVDERSIEKVNADDIRGFTQCHFFAGIGVWSYALRCAGWDDARPVWTGSCPCQSFSAAGKQAGFADPRHLWPAWFRLIRECRPATVFGEQVDAAIRHGWLDLVQADLEGEGYAVGKAVLGACSVGAPHRRQRLYFVADSNSGKDFSATKMRLHSNAGSGSAVCGLANTERSRRYVRGRSSEECVEHRIGNTEAERGSIQPETSGLCNVGELGDTEQQGLEGFGRPVEQRSAEGWETPQRHSATAGGDGRLEQPNSAGPFAGQQASTSLGYGSAPDSTGGITRGFWHDAEWLWCRDGKWRPTQPGLFPLAARSAGRVGRLRGYGNAICAPVAQAFIEAARELKV